MIARINRPHLQVTLAYPFDANRLRIDILRQIRKDQTVTACGHVIGNLSYHVSTLRKYGHRINMRAWGKLGCKHVRAASGGEQKARKHDFHNLSPVVPKSLAELEDCDNGNSVVGQRHKSVSHENSLG